jgi:hypothetical protein
MGVVPRQEAGSGGQQGHRPGAPEPLLHAPPAAPVASPAGAGVRRQQAQTPAPAGEGAGRKERSVAFVRVGGEAAGVQQQPARQQAQQQPVAGAAALPARAPAAPAHAGGQQQACPPLLISSSSKRARRRQQPPQPADPLTGSRALDIILGLQSPGGTAAQHAPQHTRPRDV